MGDNMTNQEAIRTTKQFIADLEASDIPIYANEREALEKLINTAKTIRWVKIMGDLNVLFDLDPNRYKINKEDWIAERDVPLEDFLDDVYEVIKDDERRV